MQVVVGAPDNKLGTLSITVPEANISGMKIQLLPNSFETEVTVAAGQTYYYEIGVATSPTGAGWGSALLMGNVGKRMDGRGSFGGNSYQFNSMDAATGAAEVRKLKPVKR